ncbi:hypothetical protein GCM10007387_49350 [Pseudoduganella albidiflava]|uniref:Uncharacterized protein n=1 Tax=Pseudoduganella albidiflava TaxID=321983 RepID=A0AA87XYY0_9BURK|nr:hypothetical protein GCM10007387_49350 [Pseudoduganella albidiflava]
MISIIDEITTFNAMSPAPKPTFSSVVSFLVSMSSSSIARKSGLEQRYYYRAAHGAQARTNGRTGPASAVDSSHETFGMEEVEPGMAMPGEMGFMVSDVSFLCIA